MQSRREVFCGLTSLLAAATAISPALGRCLTGPGEPIHEQTYVSIGGIDQWIEIMGTDRRNPVLLVLNGGPGSTWDPFTDLFQDWEQHFTMVYWSQRGAGKTYRKTAEAIAGTMTLERMVDDGLEVATYLCAHLHKQQLIVLGHSWGSLLGVSMLQKRPELFAAFVGTGQVTNFKESERLGREEAIRRAKAAGRDDAVRELEALGATPYDDVKKLATERKWAGTFDTPLDAAFDSSWKNPDWFTKADAGERYHAWLFSNFTMYDPKRKDVLETNLIATARSFRVPVIFIQGSEDHITPTSLVADYEKAITAPRKALVQLPGGGHDAIFAMKDAFLKAMLEQLGDLAC